jgi:hypothetical protein
MVTDGGSAINAAGLPGSSRSIDSMPNIATQAGEVTSSVLLRD